MYFLRELLVEDIFKVSYTVESLDDKNCSNLFTGTITTSSV